MISKKILLVRREMRGDVLLCSAIARELKLRDPNAQISFLTKYVEVFDNNPRVHAAFDKVPAGYVTPLKYNLNLVMYEQMPGWHLIDGFAKNAGFPKGTCPHVIEMFPRDEVIDQMSSITAPLNGYVVVAPGPGLWEGRNWPEALWVELINILMADGLKVVLTGVGRTYRLPHTMDLRDMTPTFGHLGALVKGARAFVGIDSFPCHVAGAVRTPRVVLFGVTSPEYILCDAPNTVAVTSDRSHKLTGIRHTVNSMKHVNIRTPADNPMTTITVDQVLRAVRSIL